MAGWQEVVDFLREQSFIIITNLSITDDWNLVGRIILGDQVDVERTLVECRDLLLF